MVKCRPGTIHQRCLAERHNAHESQHPTRRKHNLISVAPLNLRLAPVSFAADGGSAPRLGDDVLAALCFSRRPASDALANVPMAALDAGGATGAAYEIWRAGSGVTHGTCDALHYSHDDVLLFGLIQLPEGAFETPANAGQSALQLATEHAYREIFKLTEALGYPAILRFWNFFADINGVTHGTERYRQFNRGRHDGFLGGCRAVTGSVPAASALGFAQGPLTICFLAARGMLPLAIENPRQVSAFHYPDEYGVRSPTFARATMVRTGGRQLLFLSGTASIVGHRTWHVGDVVAQTRETVTNLRAIVDEANRVAPQAGFTMGELCCRVYVRHACDVGAIEAELRASLGHAARLTFLEADICRAELLVEIEATAGVPIETAQS
jgi:chorismate lyase/3-hydroxybenzoate synthase